MKSFSRFLLEKNNKTSSIKGSSDSYIQPNLFDTSKTGKENPVKDVQTTKDIIGNRRRRGRPIGSTNKVVNPNAPIQSSIDTNTLKNQTNTNTSTNKLSNKKLSGDGKIVIKPNPGEVKLSREILKQQTPGTNISVNTSGASVKNRPGTVTSNVTNTTNVLPANVTSGGKVKTNKPQVTTNVTNPRKFKNFLDRVLVSTGVKTDPKYKSKFTTPTSNVTVSGSQSGTNKVLSQVSKNALRNNIFKGIGRFAGGAFAAKDAYDKARDEKLLGRSRISQILGGLARGAGGYIGGALGATLGTLAGGGVGSALLGTGGAITGYNIGTRVGDFLYDKGRKLATGETKIKLPGKKTFNKFKDDVSNKVKNLNLRNLGRNESDKK